MAYEMKNGLLYKDGVAQIAIGSSYYPSFHKAKFQVPPEGDRIGEMKKDLKLMQDYGFNFLRTAALGELELKENGELAVHTDFIDRMAEECAKRDLACSVRLNGYVTNLSGNTNYAMINHRGEEMKKEWSTFLEFCLHHPGILKDNDTATKALAEHFSSFDSVVSYQIYNEPHYPANGRFDYHPCAIEAYRKYLVAHGILTEAAAKDYMPPHEKPIDKESIAEWIRWRIFSMYSMTAFLNHTSDVAKSGASQMETYTCFTSAEGLDRRVSNGVNYFDDGMDVVGLTQYGSYAGSDFYTSMCVLDICACAAELKGKPAWMIEADARMKMPAWKMYAQSYAAIGAGFKGLCYYEWRGDYPYEGTPLPDNCGFFHYDGTKCFEFDEKMKLIPVLNRYSEALALAKRTHSGVAILNSDYASAYGDAVANTEAGGRNIWLKETLATYAQLTRQKLQVDFVRAEHLKENKFGIKILFVPVLKFLPEEEIAAIEEFISAGGKVYHTEEIVSFNTVNILGFRDYENPRKPLMTDDFDGALEMEDVVEANSLTPLVQTNNRNLFAKVLEGESDYYVTVINNSATHKQFENQRLDIALPMRKAFWITKDGECELTIENGSVVVPEIDYSFMLRLEK